jgi:hypothetical protein
MKKSAKAAKSTVKVTQDEVDRFVTAQADHESAWDRPISIRKPKSMLLSIPAELAARASFLARIHREHRLDKWVEKVVRERVEIEESAYRAAKKGLSP